MAEQQSAQEPGQNERPYTKLYNDFFDEAFKQIDNLAELKVVLLIIRKTVGWGKEEDMISLSQLIKETGLSKQSVVKGTEAGLKRGIITRKATGQSFAYRLNLDYQPVKNVDQCSNPTCQDTRLEVVKELDYQLVKNVDTQKKDLNKIKERERGDLLQPVKTLPVQEPSPPVLPIDLTRRATRGNAESLPYPDKQNVRRATTEPDNGSAFTNPISPELQELELSPAIQAYKAAWPKVYARMVTIPVCLVALKKLAATATDIPALNSVIGNWLANPHRDASNIANILDAYGKLVAPTTRHGTGMGQQPPTLTSNQQQAQATYTNVSDSKLDWAIGVAERDLADPHISDSWRLHCQTNLTNNLAEKERRRQAKANQPVTVPAESVATTPPYQQSQPGTTLTPAQQQEARNYAYAQA